MYQYYTKQDSGCQAKIDNPVLTRFINNLPRRPYCTDNPTLGQYIHPLDRAIHHLYIQPNFGISAYLIFDIDYNGVSWYDFDLPQPSITTATPQKGTCHYCYELATPILKWQKASLKAIRFADAVTHAYTETLRADAGYSGLLTKNPLHPFWLVETYNRVYTLDELACHVELPTMGQAKKVHESDDIGRNCAIFNSARRVAYKIAKEYESVESLKKEVWRVCIEINQDSFSDDLLPDREVEGIAESIARWTFPRRFDFGVTKRLGHDELKTTLTNNALATNKKRNDKTRQTIRNAIRSLENSGVQITVSAVAKKTGYARKTVRQTSLINPR